MAQAATHSTATLAVCTAAGFGSGLYLGYLLWARADRDHSRSGPTLAEVAALTSSTLARDGSAAEGAPASSGGLGGGGRAPGALGPVSHPLGLRMAVLVRQDVDLPPWRVVEHAVWAVLGMWKKLYKRGDPAIQAWDRGGARLDVLGAPVEDDLLLVQSAARSLALPTHTFAGRDPSHKERSVMAIGPADSEVLREITGHLKRLS